MNLTSIAHVLSVAVVASQFVMRVNHKATEPIYKFKNHVFVLFVNNTNTPKGLISLNISVLNKVLKQSVKKGRLFWQLTESGHYVSDSIIAIRFDTLPHELKLTLLSLFGETPSTGSTLVIENKKTHESNVDFQGIVLPNPSSIPAKVSPLYYKDETFSTRIIVSEQGDLTLVKDQYADIFCDEEVTSTKTSVLFINGICMAIGSKKGVTWQSIIRNELKL